jgi:DivIVA domain-containing protein
VVLTPEEIKNKEFRTAHRGYDCDEVASFLRIVAEEFSAVQEAGGGSLDDGARGEDPFSALGENVAGILRDVSVRASSITEAAERGVAEARHDAERMRREAEELHLEAKQLRDQASEMLNEANREASSLRDSASAAAERLNLVAREHELLVDATHRLRGSLGSVEEVFEMLKSKISQAGDLIDEPHAQ